MLSTLCLCFMCFMRHMSTSSECNITPALQLIFKLKINLSTPPPLYLSLSHTLFLSLSLSISQRSIRLSSHCGLWEVEAECDMQNEAPGPAAASASSISTTPSVTTSLVTTSSTGRPTLPHISVYAGIPGRQTAQVQQQQCLYTVSQKCVQCGGMELVEPLGCCCCY